MTLEEYINKKNKGLSIMDVIESRYINNIVENIRLLQDHREEIEEMQDIDCHLNVFLTGLINYLEEKDKCEEYNKFKLLSLVD